MRSWVNRIRGYWVRDKKRVMQFLKANPYYCAHDLTKKRDLRIRFVQFLGVTTLTHTPNLPHKKEAVYTVVFGLSCLTLGFKKLPNEFPQSIVVALASNSEASICSKGTLYVWLDINGGWKDNPFDLLPILVRALRLEGHFTAERSNPWSRPTRFRSFVGLAEQEMKAILTGESSFFPSEVAGNFNELFIECIYKYFDNPLGLRQNHPLLYQSMVILFMQDPALLYQKASLVKV